MDGGDICNGHGRCVNRTNPDNGTVTEQCICSDAWGNTSCTYKKHSQVLVFLMSFFFGSLGVDRFIIGHTWQGVLKLLLGLSGCFLPCIALCVFGFGSLFGDGGKIGGGVCAVLIGCLLFVAIVGCFVWWLADVILFGTNKIHDSHGYLLAPW
jgi:hypothetical protein